MMFRDVLTLIGEQPKAHGVTDVYEAKERTVYCTVRSVGMNEAYQALANGLQPQFVFSLSEYADYEGEKQCVYHGVRYRIIRTYRKNQGIELTVEEVSVDR